MVRVISKNAITAANMPIRKASYSVIYVPHAKRAGLVPSTPLSSCICHQADKVPLEPECTVRQDLEHEVYSAVLLRLKFIRSGYCALSENPMCSQRMFS